MSPNDTWDVGLAWEPPRLDPDRLPDVLTRLEYQVRRRRLRAADLMRPGLDRTGVIARLEGVGIQAHPDLITWWSWRNGDEPGVWGMGHFSYGYYQLSLDEAIQGWQKFAADLEWEDDLPLGVEPHYVPFMRSSGRGFLLDTRKREVVNYTAEYSFEEWHRYANMATVLNSFVINLAMGKDWPLDTPGIHTPDPNYHPETG